MKFHRPYIEVMVGLVLGLAVLAWWLRPAKDSPTQPAPAFPAQEALPLTREASPPPASPEPIQTPDPSAPAPLFPPGPSQGLNDPRWKQWNEMERKDSRFQWKTPIRFYGKVVDEDGNPVKGAKIRMGWNGMLGSQERFLTSDAQGLFSITGIRGKLITAKPSHPDYHFSLIDNQWAFDYAAFYEPHYHVPDAKNPVVFKMVRKGVPEPLIEFERRFVEFNQDRTLEIKLPGKLTLVWKLIENYKKPYDHDPANLRWKSEVKINGAQLQPCMEEFPRKAPAEGYKPQIDLDLSTPQPPNWISDKAGGRFYVQSENGYGLLVIDMFPGSGTGNVYYLHNPTPSRNLEIDSFLVRRQ